MKKILWSERIKRPPKRSPLKPTCANRTTRFPVIPKLVIPGSSRWLYSIMAVLWPEYGRCRYVGKYLVGSIREMAKSAKSVRDNPYAGKKTIDAETLKELEAYAHNLGVTDIGYTRVNPRHIFKGFKLLFPNAMVFTMEMDREKIKQAPSMPSFIEIFRTYHQLGVIVNQVSEFLRERGFNALAGPAIGGDVNYIPVAIDAGLVSPAKMGC